MESIPYSSVVGSLMYAQTCTRPNISFVVGMLGRYQSNLGIDHWKATKKVLRYLKGMNDYMLMYRRSKHLEVVGYSDSDFAGCIDTRKSTFGLGVVDTITKRLTIYCDNSAAVFFSKNNKYSKGVEHMGLKYFTVKEEVQKQKVSLEHIRTDLMIADPLTKGLHPKIFKEHVHIMGLGCIYD
ncbi:secreted RxLR effector protein 161-like [Nicotiana sylvestris]|uniref:secreted RxLR effector protein 161-like n=1 Tax=Nicotiana sylvestris TaxID=4096 RepID=UPI00388C9D0E